LRLTTPAAAARQEMVVDALSAGRRYHYEVITPRPQPATSTATSPSAPDCTYTCAGDFTTAPAPGMPFEFIIWGDSRTDTEVCRKLSRMILASGVPMTLHSGDFVSAGVKQNEWDQMFLWPMREMLRSVVLWPAVGNHDVGETPEGVTDLRNYRQVFSLPGK